MMTGYTGGLCPAYFFCRFSDAVWAKYAGGVSVSYGYIARPPVGSNEWNGVDKYRILGYISPNVCSTVRMVGKTTGSTTGKVTNTWIDFHSYDNYLYIYLKQHRASYQRAGGDSGAPVFSLSGTDVYLHGSHWTGNTDSGEKCGISVNSFGIFSETSFMINELGLTTDLSYQGGP